MAFSEGAKARIHYRSRGVQSRKPCVLLVHGAGGGSGHFSLLMERLAAERKVVAVDLPGHGKSEPFPTAPADDMLVERYVDACAELAERIGLGRFIWVGHSMGGGLGLSFAQRHPDRLAGLGLIATAARVPISRTLLAKLDRKFDTLPELFIETSYSPYTDREKARRLAADQLQCGKAQLLGDFRACRVLDYREKLPEISHPAVVVSALDDIITPPKLQRQLADTMPRAELVEVARAGHFVMRERPEPVLAALESLFRRALPLSPPIH